MKKGFIGILIALAFQTPAALSAGADGPAAGGGIYYTEPINTVLFTHASHGEKQGLACDRCHSGLFEMEALRVQTKKDFTMDSLYRGKYCGTCHNGKQAFASDTQCARCHIRVKGLEPGQKPVSRDIPAYKASDSFGKGETTVRFGHASHARTAQCGVCHPGIFRPRQGANRVAMADHGKKRLCFVCHDGQKAFSGNDCSRCHAKLPAPKAAAIFGKGDKGVSFRHQTHLAKLECGSCHPTVFPYTKGTKITFADHSAGKACFTCHRSTNGTSFYSDCSRCHTDRKAAAAPVSTPVAAPPPAAVPSTAPAAAPVSPPASTPSAPPAASFQGPGPLDYTIEGAGPVQFLHKSHGSFACSECHPKWFAMKKGGSKMTMAEMYQGKSCGSCHDGKKAFASMQCAKCHKSN
jgi:c(7)-type cytochrome triheme protein